MTVVESNGARRLQSAGAAQLDSLLSPAAEAGDARMHGLSLYQCCDGQIDAGVARCDSDSINVTLDRDALIYVIDGGASIADGSGQPQVLPEKSLVFMPSGWSGLVSGCRNLRYSYVAAGASSRDIAAPLMMPSPATQTDLTDWGQVPTTIEGDSMTSGLLLFRGEQNEHECGMWQCTEGYWTCHVERDEWCHFLSGRARYRHESGESFDVEADTLAWFPAGWRGTCTVIEAVRKVYMIL